MDRIQSKCSLLLDFFTESLFVLNINFVRGIDALRRFRFVKNGYINTNNMAAITASLKTFFVNFLDNCLSDQAKIL